MEGQKKRKKRKKKKKGRKEGKKSKEEIRKGMTSNLLRTWIFLDIDYTYSMPWEERTAS